MQPASQSCCGGADAAVVLRACAACCVLRAAFCVLCATPQGATSTADTRAIEQLFTHYKGARVRG
jgi:hypothetical protein